MIGGPEFINEGDRYYRLTEHDDAKGSGPWRLVWAVKRGKAATRLLAGASRSASKWETVDNKEGIRVQTLGPKGWR